MNNEKLLHIIKVLGTGAALSPDLTNTSFSLLDGQILVDCGYNVFPHLYKHEKNILDNLKYIFITHCHADHMGSLESLIYYNEFVRKKPLIVYISEDTFIAKFIKVILNGKIDYTLNINVPFDYTSFRILTNIDTYPVHEYESPYSKINEYFLEIIKDKIPDRYDVNNKYVEFINSLYPSEFKFSNPLIHKLNVRYITRQNHFGYYLNTSYIFEIDLKHFTVIIGISGDMRADKVFEKSINKIVNQHENIEYYVFHDCRNTNLLTNVHASDFDISQIYSKEFREHIIKVHNNKKPEISEIIYHSVHGLEKIKSHDLNESIDK